jgi:hypothetical protein
VMVMLVIAIALDVVYWTIWFTARDWIASEHTSAYYEFEDAFPLADAWLGIACVAALVALARRSRTATFWCTAAGAAGLYLFGMDLLYDVENGIFAQGGGGAFEAIIVGLTLVFSLTLLRYAWSRGAEREPSDAAPADVRT